MKTKRRRQAVRNAEANPSFFQEDEALLDKGLVAELGKGDQSNRLVVASNRKKGKRIRHSSDAPSTRDRKQEQIEKKKEEDARLKTIYRELKKHSLSESQWTSVQAAINRQKNKRKSEKPPQSSSSDNESDPSSSPRQIREQPPDVTTMDLGIPVAETVIPSETELPPRIETSQSRDNPRSPRGPFKPHRVIHVVRSEEIEKCRSDLPIISYEQEIMELVTENDVVVICGQTGCGKTTQVPQYLYEAGYGCKQFPERAGMIGVTQPRRIAATTTAARVAAELNVPLGQVVGFQVRHDKRIVDTSTSIKFMTDGILIREIQGDFLLKQYSALIIDEAHERSLNTDLLLGMLSRVTKLRRKLDLNPLKVIIMSATLESGAFLDNKKLFRDSPPLIEIPARQFPVTVHFSRRTEVDDYESAAMNKVCRIHRQLPPGGILVFVTGKREVDRLCSKLRQRLAQYEDWAIEEYSSEEDTESIPGNVEADVEESIEECRQAFVLPLYAMLPSSEQSRVFHPVPEGHRLVVVSTNVAETSVTIPGIRYVVDTGRAKKKILNSDTGVSHFQVDWISKASAVQRAGRAGRTMPGHCYRLYSSAHFGNAFPEFELPEISCVSLESVVLLMKSMGIHKVANFPFPTQPDREAIEAAEDTLVAVGAISGEGRIITEVGRKLSEFPVCPRHAKLIWTAKEIEEEESMKGLTLFGLALAAAMSVESPFLHSEERAVKELHKVFVCTVSDPISSMIALIHYRQEKDLDGFCRRWFLHGKIMAEMASLETQLRQIFLRVCEWQSPEYVRVRLPDPSRKMIDQLRRCILAGWCDRLGRSTVRFREGEKRHRGVAYTTPSHKEDDLPFYIHPLSSSARSSPQFVVYMNAMKTKEKIYMNQVTRVEPEWAFRLETKD